MQQRHDREWTVAELAPPAQVLSRNELDDRETESKLTDPRRRRAADSADEDGDLVAW